ncbi:MAG: TRAP transporter large permease subunit, partial [Rickettsiales bacterium]|nr:TRAP transporter large permease subunit [Rickettsiales bacterium]
MMAINLQTSFLTPPFGFSLFYLRGVASKEVKTMDIYRGVLPFVGIQVVMLAALSFAPGLATWMPKALYDTKFEKFDPSRLEELNKPKTSNSWDIDF